MAKDKYRWLVGMLLLVSFGCQSLPLMVGNSAPQSAENLWEQGQDAMHQGQIHQAIDLFEEGLAADPAHNRSHLSLAVAYLESGRTEIACHHLAQFVEAHPHNLQARALLAELLFRQNRRREARDQWERFLTGAQEENAPTMLAQIRGHNQLAALAEADEDDYRYHLHRGIGLYLLARCRAELTEADGLPVPESLLCKAAGELAHARLLGPGESQPCWYLYEVWRRLGQHQQAQRWLRQAAQAAPFSPLTPAEQRSLILATSQSIR